jgi:minor histocompatibility antigen H13
LSSSVDSPRGPLRLSIMDWITNYIKFEGDSPTLQLIGEWGYKAYAKRDLILMHTHLILAALFPIYIGSHASLRRPPSAEIPSKSKMGDEEDDEIQVEPVMEGLRLSDAILFPITASATLAGLYFLIKWLNDPALLNKILGYYFSLLGVFGVGKLAADGLNVATTFVFPSVWSSRSATYYVDPVLSQQVTGQVKTAKTQLHRKFTDKTNPLPGILSSISFPKSITTLLWALRALLKNHWIFRGYLHGIFNYKTKLQLNDVTGFIIGIVAIVLYNTNGKEWWLTNVIGFGLCYGTLQLLSPTSFWIGSMLMSGLFVYDIVMVFYTPLMVTVATTIDGPIKLVFPGPARGSMLGLGDIVLPGIVMALALRFDLYLHYLSKQTKSVSANSTSVMRAAYVEASGKWGERFWTQGAKNAEMETVADRARFPKIYFKASMAGYVLGMVATLAGLHIYRHAQPALLYLVPCVLTSLWGTAFMRSELGLMWGYTEDGSLVEGQGKERGKGGSESSNDSGTTITPVRIEAEKKAAKCKGSNQHAEHVFLFSLSAPKQQAVIPKEAKLFDDTGN